MAVAVEEAPSVVLDDEYRIVEVSAAAEAALGLLRGRSILDSFPGSAPLFRPHYERARRTGERQEFVQYYDAYVVRVTVDPGPEGLTVSWTTLCALDLVTIDGLRESLAVAVSTLERADAERRRADVRRSLRVVEGGA